MKRRKTQQRGQQDNFGIIHKSIEMADKKKLTKGIAIAKEILIKSGAKKNSLYISKPAGVHPGGTAAIGKIVDSNFRTKVQGLYVCDASVIPGPFGVPPILTIIAMTKYFARINKFAN